MSEPAAGRLSAARSARSRRTLTAALLLAERESLWLLVAAAYAILLAVKLPVLVAPDTWLALVGGREIAEHGIPHHETLTLWAAGREWVDQQWLAQLAIYGAAAGGGLRLALALHFVVLTGALTIVLVGARRLGASPRSTALGGLMFLLGGAASTALRAQTLALPLFALLLWLLLSDRHALTRRTLLALPLIALWANLHGTAVLAAGLVMLRGLGGLRSRPRVASALLVGAPAALLASPYSTALVGYYGRTVGNRSFSQFVTEWAPPSFPSDWRIFLLAAIALWLVSRHAAQLTRYEKVVFVVLLLAALAANRQGVWLALFAGLALPRLIDAEWPPTSSSPPRRLNALAGSATALLLAAVLVASFSRPASWYEQQYPAAAAASVAGVLRQEPSSRVFSSEGLADWLLWKVPEVKGRLAFDIRYELLTRDQLVHISEFVNSAEGWRSLLRGYRIAVLDPIRDARNERTLMTSDHAVSLFRDERISALLLPKRGR